MTGFGSGQAELAGGLLQVELRAVNHRHLDVKVRCPDSLDASSAVDEVLRAHVVRGHIDATLRWDVANARAGILDQARAREVYAALSSLSQELAPGSSVPFEAVLAVPGVLVRGNAVPVRAELEEAARKATLAAVQGLLAMRVREGAALAADLLERAELLRRRTAWIEGERPRLLAGFRERLLGRVSKLLEGTDLAVDAGRLSQEVAWLADRSDVVEELKRLAVHLTEVTATLKGGGAVGRKLDFLVQELGREINTIGSKANDADIARCVVEMKTELERIREQVQNIL
ncbi:MAG TPA: YicC/YloC family endoribonuclease [Polyangiales bacterium]